MRPPRLPFLAALTLLGAATSPQAQQRPVGAAAPAAATAPDSAAAAETQTAFEPSPYRIVRVDLPPAPAGPQTGVSRGVFMVNFGWRDGVQRGSILNVRHRGILMGVVRVDRVWADSAAASLVYLVHKARPQSPAPLERGYYLEPRLVFLQSVTFKAGKPDVTLAMHERIAHAARFIRAFPRFPLIIEGHTDNTGKAADNQKLSEARAEEIRQFLHEIHRLSLEQMHVKGYGQTDPLLANTTEEGRRQNRRVDIILADRLPD